ncbi:MAG: universal stress protein [Gemmatimonadaceae bacterium]
MTTALRTATDILATYEPIQLPTGPLLVASDTSPDSDAAFPVAQILAAQTHATVQVVSAVRPATMPMYAFDGWPVPIESATATRDTRESMIKAQMARLVPSATPWPVSVPIGEPIREISDQALQLKARMILVGRGRHGPLTRTLAGESVLRLLQLGDTPVLAVEPTLTALPKRVVIATDFSAFSLYAAQVAMQCVAPDAQIYLAHVAPPFVESDPVLREHAVAYRNQVRDAFAQLRERLTRKGLTLSDVILEGNATDRLIEFAASSNADLIVAATHGYGFIRRMILGSVAAQLVRGAPCSVLCVPGSARTMAAARAHTPSDVRTRALPMDRVDTELNTCTERNQTRPCTIELDERALGAQILGHALPFVGATYDFHAQAISLMFGASALEGQHLTHVISHVSAVDLTTDHDGTDRVLRLVYPEGQTLILFE